MKTQILLLIGLLFTGSVIGQGFQKTIYNPKKDFNHYSIENTSKGYVCVGTLFGEKGNDIHIVHLNNTGDVTWEQIIDKTKDDRGLDVVVDGKGDIVLTGYLSPKRQFTGQTSEEGYPNLYIAKIDLDGNFLGDQLIQNSPISPDPLLMSAGTNIIYSEKNESYIVGGILASKFEFPLQSNSALLVEFTTGLNIINQRVFNIGGNDFHSINDIQELPEGYFLTGGMEEGNDWQGLFAVVVDFNFTLEQNMSFVGGEKGTNLGASAFYDKGSNGIYVMSNNSMYKNPQITYYSDFEKRDLCDTNFNASSYIIEIDKKGDFEPVGFKLAECAWDKDHLMASGYFRKRESDYGDAGTIAWIIEFDKKTGTRISGMEWTISPANGFTDHGGLLSEFNPNSPRYYTPEIMTVRNDGEGYVVIAPRIIEKKYSLELFTTYYRNVGDCFVELDFNSFELVDFHFDCNCLTGGIDFKELETGVKLEEIRNYEEIFCEASYNKTSLGTELAQLDEKLKAYPNPANNLINVQLPNGVERGKIEIVDLSGKRVFESTVNLMQLTINVSTFDNGVYFIRLTSAEGKVYEEKFVKSNS